MQSRFEVGKGKEHLWTRQLGAEIRVELERILAQLEPGDVVVLDLKGVQVFDYSFAAELFGKILLSVPREYPGRFVVFEHLTEYTRENLEKALETLGLVAIERDDGRLGLIGKVHPADRDTFRALVDAGEALTAAELTELLHVNVTAMNERLSKLSALGVMRRQPSVSAKGREQYRYRVLA